MKNLYAQVGHYDYAEQQIQLLKKEVSGLQYAIFGLIFVIVLLFTAIFLQWRIIFQLRKKEKESAAEQNLSSNAAKSQSAAPNIEPKEKNPKTNTSQAIKQSKHVAAKQLPDPGLIFKFSLAQEQVQEKTILVGQKNGTIKTYSTEIMDDHLSIYIRILENRADQDIYNLPDIIYEQYQLYLRRDGKVLLYYPGLSTYQEMSSRERIYIKQTKEDTGELTFANLDAQQPIRFRLGDRLNQDGKFVSGYFEFHLFTQDYETKTKSGIKKIEKNFFLRLYKIYPGYDTAAQNDEGLFPMVDPFSTK